MNISIKQLPLPLGVFLFYITCLSLFSFSLPFFWDAVAYSQIADWQLSHGIFNWNEPLEIDTGHSPLWSSIISIVWSITGKSLYSIHALMLVNNLVAAYLFYKISSGFLNKKALILSLFLFCIDTTLIAQFSSLNSDPVMLTLCLCGIYLIFNKKTNYLVLLLILLSLLNVRGWFISFALLCCDWLFNRSFRKTFIQGLITGAVIVTWCCFHYYNKGWVISSPAFIEYRRLVSPELLLRNIVLIAWRLMDFGKAAIWVVIIFFSSMYLFKNRRQLSLQDPLVRLLIVTGTLLTCFALVFIPFSNPIGHRYFLPVIALSYILFPAFVEKISSTAVKRIVILFSIGLLLSGSFWVYPDSIAKGWDSNIVYAAYPKLDREMREELAKQSIKPEEVHTRHPLLSERTFTFLDNQANYSEFKPGTSPDFQYLLYSNLSNGYSDEELATLQDGTWIKLSEKKFAGLKLILYKKNLANAN